jgi:hypothetical protein
MRSETFDAAAAQMRSAAVTTYGGTLRNSRVGFRVARTLAPEEEKGAK